MKPWVKYTLATTIFVVGIGGNIAYNQFFAPYLTSEGVYVAANEMKSNTPIQVGDYKYERIAKTQISPGAVTNQNELMGKYTAQVMSQGQQFTILDTEADPFVITSGTMDVPISSSWIAAVSPTLRRGDYVEIVPLSKPQSNTAPNAPQTVPSTSPSVLNDILVLSVHTNTNQEVTNAPQSPGPQTLGARGNGIGTPSVLDLLMTTAQAQQFSNEVQQQDTFSFWGVAKP